MILDGARPLGKLQHLETGEAKPVSLCLHNVTDLCAAAVIGKDHLDFFYAELSRNDRPKTEFQRRLKDDPFVRRRHSLNDRFAKAPRTVDNDSVAKTALSIEREHHARARDIRAHHRLDADRKCDVEMIKAFCGSV